MKLESQVIPLSLAKMLKELGVKVNSFAVWIDTKQISFTKEDEPFVCDAERVGSEIWSTSKAHQEEIKAATYPAYTVAELGEMFGYGSRATEWLRNEKIRSTTILSMTDAKWLGEKLIEAIETNLLTIEQINERI